MTPDEILLVQVGRGQPCALQTGTVLRAAPLHPGVPQPLPRHDRGHSRRSLLYDNGIIKLCQRSDRVIYFIVTLQRRICLPSISRPRLAISSVCLEGAAVQETRGCEPVPGAAAPAPAAVLTLTPSRRSRRAPPARGSLRLSKGCSLKRVRGRADLNLTFSLCPMFDGEGR